MPKRGVVRRGTLWQPSPFGQQQPGRVAGRLRLRWPRLSLPRWWARWRKFAVVASVLALVMVGGWWLYRSPLLSIRDVSVEGNRTLSAELLRTVADLEGESILRPDFAEARERLLRQSMVKEVRISRDLPAGAHITIVERAPWGIWQVRDQRYVIDEEGVVLDLPAPKGAPVIAQTDAAQPPKSGDRVDWGAVAVARQLVPTAQQALRMRVIALEFSRASGLTAVLLGPDDSRLRATFGDAQGYDFKLAALYAVLRQAAAEERTLRSVDLRFGDRVAVQ